MKYLYFLSALLLVPVTLFAQVPGEVPPSTSVKTQIPEGLVSCFDHYTYGSIPASLTGTTETVAAGTDLTLSGTIVNNNDYPVAGVKIYAKIFDASNTEKNAQGPDVLDDFLVIDFASFGENYPIDGFTLGAGETRSFVFSYPLASSLPDGDYRVGLYTIAENRYNMAGLSFTDDVIGGSYPFTLVGGGTGAPRFDKESFTVNGESHRFAAFPTSVLPNTKEITIEGQIENPTDGVVTGTLIWTLYPWDARNGAAIETKAEPVAVPANGTLPVSYVITNESEPVYQVVGRFDTVRGSSVVGLRIVREGIDEPRINFAGIDVTDSGHVLFACLHNTGESEVMEGAEVTVEVLTKGVFTRTLAEKTYQGPVTGDIVALASPVSLLLAEPTLIVRTTLTRGGTPVDMIETEYACSEFKGCGPISLEQLLVGLLVLIALGVPALLLFRKKSAPSV